MSWPGIDRLTSRGMVIDFAAKALRRGDDPRKVVELLELHSERLYTVPLKEVPTLVVKLAREVKL